MAEGLTFSDEKQLLCDLREGGAAARQACTVLYRRYFPELVRHLRRFNIAVKHQDIEDAVQAVFLKIAQGRLDYKGKGSLFACLMSCSQYALMDMLKKRDAQEKREICHYRLCGVHQQSEPSPSHAMQFAERDQSVREAVKQLPSEQRYVIEMLYVDQQTHQHTAEYISVNRRTVQRRRASALKKLEQLLADFLSGE